jgi:hypothetical protein
LKCNIEDAHKNVIADAVGGSRAEIGLVLYWILYGLCIVLPIQFAGWLSNDKPAVANTSDGLPKA